MDERMRRAYTDVLKKELVPAFGCTEPIAVAYASAVARQVLGRMPEKIIAECSGNIMKNAKGVIVPNTKNMRGIDVSAVLGAVGGDPHKGLEVLQKVTQQHLEQTKELLMQQICEVKNLKSACPLHIRITVLAQEHSAMVEIKGSHTHIAQIKKDDRIVQSGQEWTMTEDEPYPEFSLRNILEFAETVPLSDIEPILQNQVRINGAIADEGMKNDYGANVGKTLVRHFGSQVWVLARAYAAAGSDARMSGCTMPVVINSGSGNQGITVSLPVIVYARHYGISAERMFRALAVSNLTAIYQKSELGKLSAFCGAVCAAAGSGAGIAWMLGNAYEVIEKTLINALANVGGIVCDGAKPSCAAKISSSVEAALNAYYMAVDEQGFANGEGLVKEDADRTVRCVMCMGRDGMKQTDEKILELMAQ